MFSKLVSEQGPRMLPVGLSQRAGRSGNPQAF